MSQETGAQSLFCHYLYMMSSLFRPLLPSNEVVGGHWTGGHESLPALRLYNRMNQEAALRGWAFWSGVGGTCLRGEFLETSTYLLNNTPQQGTLQFLVLVRRKRTFPKP